jgi:hypothetical protein
VWTPADELLALDGTGELRVWSGTDLAPRQHWPVGPGRSLSLVLRPGTRSVLVVKGLGVQAIDLDTGASTPQIAIEDAAYHAAISPDGSLAAVSRWAGRVTVWRPATRQVVRELEVASGAIWGVDISRDGSLVAAVDWGGTAYVWDLATGELLHTRRLIEQTFGDVRFSPDGRALWVRAGDWTMERFAMDSRRGREAASAALAGSPAARAAAFAELGWWARVVPELDAGVDDPVLRVQALLALGRRHEAVDVAKRDPSGVYMRVVAGLDAP